VIAASRDRGLEKLSQLIARLTPRRATALDRLDHLWNRYSSAAVAMLKSTDKTAVLERVKQHQAQMKVVAG
jgi:hypothetical protein